MEGGDIQGLVEDGVGLVRDHGDFFAGAALLFASWAWFGVFGLGPDPFFRRKNAYFPIILSFERTSY